MQWHFDRVLRAFDFLRIDGWLFAPGDRVCALELVLAGAVVPLPRVAFNLPSPDIALHPACRFSLSCLVDEAVSPSGGLVRAQLQGGETIEMPLPGSPPDWPNAGFDGFLARLRALDRPRVLEVGSRARSGVVRRELFAGMDYTGVDIVAAPNVDHVVDAHRLSDALGRDRFDAVFSLAVFEHLAMPWKVAVEINRVLRTGGLAYTLSTQTLGLHDMPWDFWRFSDSGYRSLFNAATGFEVLQARLETPMHVFPFVHHSPFWDGSQHAAGFGMSDVLARKVSDTTLDWDVPLDLMVSIPYPA